MSVFKGIVNWFINSEKPIATGYEPVKIFTREEIADIAREVCQEMSTQLVRSVIPGGPNPVQQERGFKDTVFTQREAPPAPVMPYNRNGPVMSEVR